jgi:hypothetical protein
VKIIFYVFLLLLVSCHPLATQFEKRLVHTSVHGKVVVADQQSLLNWHIVSTRLEAENNCFYYFFNPDSAKISSKGDFNFMITGFAHRYNFQSICDSIPDSLFDSLKFNIYLNSVLMDSVVEPIFFKIDRSCFIKIEGAHSIIDTTMEPTPVNDLGLIKIPRY